MIHAVVLAGEMGENLHPLTHVDCPTPFLALGERRTLLRQNVDRLARWIPRRRQWIVVRHRHRTLAEECLPGGVHVLIDSFERGAIGAVAYAVARLRSTVDPDTVILIQPSTHVVGDEEAFRDRLVEAVDLARLRNRGIAFTVKESGYGDSEVETGIQLWPLKLALKHFPSTVPVEDATASAEAVSRTTDDLLRIQLGDVDWIDVSNWKAVYRLLEYVEKPWGRECLWALNRHYAGKLLFIKAGESLSLQYHREKDETIRLESGQMKLRVGQGIEELETIVLDPGMRYAIPPRLLHQMEAVTDCTVIEVSTPHLTDVVRLGDRYGRA